MKTKQIESGPRPMPLRLWPGVAIVVLQWLAFFVLPALVPEATIIAVLAGAGGGLAILVWWVFFSRAAWIERLGAVVLMAAAVFAVRPLLHESIAGAGMGVLFFIYVVPPLCLAFVLWAVVSRGWSDTVRRVTMVAAIVLGCGVWTLARTGGINPELASELTWRWTPTAEERLLARAGDEVAAHRPAAVVEEEVPEAADEPPVAEPATAAAVVVQPPPAEPATTGAPAAAAAGEGETPAPDRGTPTAEPQTRASWPGFRGPGRDGVVSGVRIATDWAAAPPVELWRRSIGPGWSSFAVAGDRIYTQEQRGEQEVVACYDARSGEPLWMHADPVRFWEANAGAGPRGTPAVAGGRVYAFGATGVLNSLDAASGAVLWSRDVAADSGVAVPMWGFSSSPLVVDDLIVVAAAGKLMAYERSGGELRWAGPEGGDGYSSPHLVTLAGVPQVLLLSGAGATSIDPAGGALLWQHDFSGFAIVQPALTAEGDLLIAADQVGTHRLAVGRTADGWRPEERWTSNRLKPNFSSVVVHEGHAYGFDGSILAAIDLADGSRSWKGGRYGYGQLVLLPEQDLLLVLTEKGELALVEAAPERFLELARVPAIAGKTWNSPVVVDDLLLVRNGVEMAAFRLARAGD